LKKRSILICLGLAAFIFTPGLSSFTLRVAKKAVIHRDLVLNPKQNCGDNIQSIEWVHSDQGRIKYVSARIVPTTCGRLGLSPRKAWDEFVLKVPPHPAWDNVKEGDDVWYSMQDQFFCHVFNFKAQDGNEDYRIEPERKHNGLFLTYYYGCNYDNP
jgi:Protein of unknown function (DUF2599)